MAIDWGKIKQQSKDIEKDLSKFDKRTSSGGVRATARPSLPDYRPINHMDRKAEREDRYASATIGFDTLGAEKERAQKSAADTSKELRLSNARENLARRAGFPVNGINIDQERERQSDLSKELQGYRRDIERIDYIQGYQDVTREDNFGGQFRASYDVGQMGQDEAMAWKDYLSNPTPQNRLYAEAVSKVREDYIRRNQDALDDDAILPWITQDLAQYLPQLKEQTIAGAKGALGGAAVGTVIPVAGTAAGAKAGYVAGRAAYGFDTMQGFAFKALLDAGLDEQTAREAAMDEAFISSLIEGGDAAIDLLTLGGGKVISALFKKSAQTGAKITKPMWKQILSGGAAVLGNALGEGIQEWTQEGVSIANQNRGGTGLLDLAGASVGQMWDAAFGGDTEALAQMNDAGAAGFRIGLMVGGGSRLTNAALERAINRQNGMAGSDVEDMASTFGPSGSRAFTNAVENGAPATGIYSDFVNAYNSGLHGREMPEATSDAISAGQMQAAYYAGQNDAGEKGGASRVSERTADDSSPERQADLLEQLRQQGGTITNRQAERLMDDQAAMKTLRSSAGLNLSAQDTMSKRRSAVKKAFARYARENAAQPTQETVQAKQAVAGEQVLDYAKEAGDVLRNGIFTDVYGSAFERTGISYSDLDSALTKISRNEIDTNDPVVAAVMSVLDGTEEQVATASGVEAQATKLAQNTVGGGIDVSPLNSFGENGRKAFANSARNSTSPEDIYPEFSRAYVEGLTGANQRDGMSEIAQAAYYAGQNDAEASLDREKRAARYAKVARTDSGLEFDEYVTGTLYKGTADREAAAKQVESLQGENSNVTMGKTRNSLKDMTEAERGALLQYKSSESYKINAKLRDGIPLTEREQKMVADLDSALEKLPKVEGTVYRTLNFDDVFNPQEEYEAFIAQHAEGMFARYKAYTSASTRTDGYPLSDGAKYGVILEIESRNARDLSGFGNNFESEALFMRRSVFDISRVTTDENGCTRIYMEEVEINGGDKHQGHDTQKRGVAMRDLQETHPAHADLQGVPGADTRGDHGRGENLRGPREEVEFSFSGSDQWTTTRVGDRNVTPKTLSEIFEDVWQKFGINITTGHVRGAGVKGTYNRRTEGVRTKIANDLPTLSHEIGHHLDNMYGLTDNLRGPALSELVNNLGDDMRAAYSKKKWKTEGLAEFVRKFLQNREVAAIDYPEFTKYFMETLTGSDAALVYQLADEINAYFAFGAQSAAGNIRFREEKGPDGRTLAEKIREKGDAVYQAWVDANHGIKRFDDAAGSEVYKLAANSAYSDAVAANIIVHDLRNQDGQYVGPGLSTVLSGINLKDKTEYRAFGEYLVVKHGPERLREGMRVFADDRQNSTNWMKARQAELEEQYPQFAEASDRLYEFQRSLLQTWGVETGLVSQDSAEQWGKRWKYYVPLNRAMGDKRANGARRGYANQNSTIKRAKGSGRDIVHPVDNVINNMVAMVNAGVRNNVMRKITDTAMRKGGLATFLEQVPTPMKQKKFNAADLKRGLSSAVEESSLSGADKDVMNEIISNIDDILIQYGRGKAFGDVVTVMKGGKPEFWKINDTGLLQSITSMNPTKMDGILDAYAVVSRFITGNITGKNLLWSIFSNAPRDIMTFFTYSKDKNPLHVFGSMGAAYVNKLKGSGMDPLYAEYLALGGGQTSAYTADRNLAKKARKNMTGSRAEWLNPLEWIAFTSDMIEMGPRFATYKMMRQKGMNPQDAFYEAMDITVNFRRGGRLSRELNKVVPFFNASVQGLDKFSRWVRGTDAPRVERGKVVRTRMTAYLLASAALAALFYGINNGDDDDEEDYQQLSNFTKNTYWLIPLGDGKYFAIPKPRELAVLASFFETCMEALAGENPHAFDEFFDYLADNAAPPVVSDLVKGDWQGAIGSLGIIGTGAYIMANRDFLGKPIESAGLSNLEPKDRYNERTSQIAKAVGEALNVSPQKVDYFFNAVFGGFWKTQKALFPVGGESVDKTLGIQNTYIKDNQYSTDLVNWLYDQAELSAQKSNSDPDDMDKAIQKKMDSNMTSFYSRYSALSKNVPETTASRGTRQLVLDMIREYQKATEQGSTTRAQEIVYDVCRESGSTKYLPSAVQQSIKDTNGVSHTLSDAQYVEYQTDYLRIYWETVESAASMSSSMEERKEAILSAKSVAEDAAKSRALKRIGVRAYDNSVLDTGTLDLGEIAYFNSVYNNTGSDKDENGNSIPGSKQDKIIDFMEGMNLTDEEWNYLWHSVYTSDKNNPRK